MTSSKPVIITCRKYGSNPFVKDETKRIGILKDSVNLGADYIDIEYDAGEKSINALIKNKKSAKIIVSYHNFKETPSNIAQVFENIKKLFPKDSGVEIFKQRILGMPAVLIAIKV